MRLVVCSVITNFGNVCTDVLYIHKYICYINTTLEQNDKGKTQVTEGAGRNSGCVSLRDFVFLVLGRVRGNYHARDGHCFGVSVSR